MRTSVTTASQRGSRARLRLQRLAIGAARPASGERRWQWGVRPWRHSAAFTLVELMVVVVITGVLSTLGFIALKQHVRAAWKAEAMNMVQSIRAAEERWRGEHMLYLNVSSPGASWYPMNPTLAVNRQTRFPFFYAPDDGTHGDNLRWLALRPNAPDSVRFGYKVNAGSAGQPMPAPDVSGSGIVIPNPTLDNWYLIQAIGDTDWDGISSFYVASSLDGEVYSVNDGE